MKDYLVMPVVGDDFFVEADKIVVNPEGYITLNNEDGEVVGIFPREQIIGVVENEAFSEADDGEIEEEE